MNWPFGLLASMSDPRAYLHDQREALRAKFVKGPISLGFFEFLSFGIKQAWACLFGGLMLAIILVTFLLYPDGAALPRYDFITICAITIQMLLLLTKLETWEEAKVIFLFHMVGTAMELFKTQIGSWAYPEPAFLKIGDVPLFSGFMYACVGSYIARIWRIFDIQFTRFPPLWTQLLLAIVIYVNFFTHHYLPDIRAFLFVATAVIYGPGLFWFKPDNRYIPMPMVLGLILVALFIWFAENIGTFAKAWTYPGQEHGWQMVSLGKLGAWYLLMIISFVLVLWVQRPVKIYRAVNESESSMKKTLTD